MHPLQSYSRALRRAPDRQHMRRIAVVYQQKYPSLSQDLKSYYKKVLRQKKKVPSTPPTQTSFSVLHSTILLGLVILAGIGLVKVRH